MLLAAPNISEGRDLELVGRIAEAFAGAATVLDVHSDATHNRSVFTLAAEPGTLARALIAGAAEAVAAIDMRSHRGAHPCIGAIDVCPVVYASGGDREAARAEAAAVAELLAAELELPVFLYGELAAAPARSERAFYREGGLARLAQRMAAGELNPDRGPAQPHPTAGAVLVTARPPLAAFNVVLESEDVSIARAVAARLRESGHGLPGVRAIGLAFEGRTQVSTNVQDPVEVPLARVVEEVRRLAGERGTAPVAAELVGLVPQAALRGFPDDLAVDGDELASRTLERRLAEAGIA